jgi:hypothetical protein
MRKGERGSFANAAKNQSENNGTIISSRLLLLHMALGKVWNVRACPTGWTKITFILSKLKGPIQVEKQVLHKRTKILNFLSTL